MGANYSCGVNYQYYELVNNLKNIGNCEFVSRPEDADVIIFSGTCSCHADRIKEMIAYIDSVLDCKRDDARTYLTGCLAREFINEKRFAPIKDWLNANIDCIVPSNRMDIILKDLYHEYFSDYVSEKGYYLPLENTANLFMSSGCTHKCSFCKTTFHKTPLVSMDFDQIKEYVDKADEEKIENMDLRGMNICQLGLDTERKYLLPDVIEYIEKKENIKNVRLVGFAYADAIRNDFKDVLRDSKKVKYIVGSMESGNNRILGLMNKGYTIEEFLDFVHFINQEYLKMLDVNIVAGFPTETMEDVKATIKALKDIKEYLAKVTVCRYKDSAFVASHSLEQLDKRTIQKHAKAYTKFLQKEDIANVLL